ncbi:MAG: DnaB-like helicase C-terminal domain-containing protein, partial [Bacteroidota bacterium]
IEQDADMVMFIYRPEYYGLEVDENNQPTKGRAEIIIAKNRHGSIVDVPLRFIGQYAKFADLDYTEGQDIYSGSTNTGITQNTDFLSQPNTKTVQSTKWDDDEPSNNDIIRRNDIDEVF